MNGGALPGTGKFVAAFASSNLGDVSPNTQGPKCIDTGQSPADAAEFSRYRLQLRGNVRTARGSAGDRLLVTATDFQERYENGDLNVQEVRGVKRKRITFNIKSALAWRKLLICTLPIFVRHLLILTITRDRLGGGGGGSDLPPRFYLITSAAL